jgi:hypothetical protein
MGFNLILNVFKWIKANIILPLVRPPFYAKKQDVVQAYINGLNYKISLNLDRLELEKLVPYQRMREIVNLMSPNDLRDLKYTRIGKNYDGGYVMVDDFSDRIVAAYSFGISNDCSWDEQIANKGIDVFMYDHTIRGLPQENNRFHFFKYGVCGFQKTKRLKTLAQFVKENNHANADELILKMDVEGAEWDALDYSDIELLKKFSQIVIEFHGLVGACYDGNKFEIVRRVLSKLNLTHQSLHVNGNGYAQILSLGKVCLPDSLEVLYVSRDKYKDKLVKNERLFPTELDLPSSKDFPSVILGKFEA